MGDHDGLFKRIFGVPTHAADMLRSVLPAALLVALDLWLLRDGRHLTALLAHILVWRTVLARVLEDFPDEARLFLRYIFLTAGPESYETVRHAILEHVPTAEAPLATVADQLIERGLQQGLTVLRDTLRLVLVQRFGTLDAAYDARIDAADITELQRVALGEPLARVFEPH